MSVCDRIYDKYGHLPFLHSLHNMGFVVLSLIHGQLDYSKTITTAVMCGMDTDCTSGTAASIVGAGSGIQRPWTSAGSTPFNDHVKTVVRRLRAWLHFRLWYSEISISGASCGTKLYRDRRGHIDASV